MPTDQSGVEAELRRDLAGTSEALNAIKADMEQVLCDALYAMKQVEIYRRIGSPDCIERASHALERIIGYAS